MSEIPASHIDESVKLEADGFVDLFEILLNPSGIVRIKNNEALSWQSHTYEGLALQLSGVETNATEEESRPSLAVVNPLGVFSTYVFGGFLNKATVVRKRVLRQHIDANTNIFVQRSWWIGRIASLTGQNIVMELRDLTEGPNFIVPARMFMPPDFPVVSLT